MAGSASRGADAHTQDSSPPPDGRDVGTPGTGVVLLLLGGCVVLLVWLGRGSYSVAETYGGLGGGWGQLLAVLAVGAGAVIGGCLIVLMRPLRVVVRARWFVLGGIVLALFVAAVGTSLGVVAHTAASTRAAHACDDPVGRTLVSFAEALEPGPVVDQDGQPTRGRDDGSCRVLVNVAPDADVDAEIARVATAIGWSRSQHGWLSPEGVSMTYDATHEPETMTLVELRGRRADSPESASTMEGLLLWPGGVEPSTLMGVGIQDACDVYVRSPGVAAADGRCGADRRVHGPGRVHDADAAERGDHVPIDPDRRRSVRSRENRSDLATPTPS
jgi:hypothetical protein